jgi:release factor glutamine methyltransferase
MSYCVQRIVNRQIDNSKSQIVNPEFLRPGDLKKQSQFSKGEMAVTSIMTRDYENKSALRLRESKPSQSQFESRCPVCELFLFFTFLCPSYNQAMQTWTIQELLNWVTEYLTGKGVDAPRLSAELLLSSVVGLKRIELYTQHDTPVVRQQLDQLHDLVERAGRDEPVAYLTGKTEFYSLELNVTPDCMIPRPETELLVQRAIEFLRTRTGVQFVCDLCTGSGCIAVAIAGNFPDARVIATDICPAALAVAAGNVEKHQLKDRVTLLCGDLFDPIMPHVDVDKFDLIACNPPYVSAAEYGKLETNVKDYEPKAALFAGDDGLDIYRRVIEKAEQFLKPAAALMLEIGYAQGRAVRELLEQTKAFAEIKIERDIHNNDRIVIARKISS